MKKFMVTYTDDFGTTHHTEVITAATLTEAYVLVDMKLSGNGAITDIFEII